MYKTKPKPSFLSTLTQIDHCVLLGVMLVLLGIITLLFFLMTGIKMFSIHWCHKSLVKKWAYDNYLTKTLKESLIFHWKCVTTLLLKELLFLCVNMDFKRYIHVQTQSPEKCPFGNICRHNGGEFSCLYWRAKYRGK